MDGFVHLIAAVLVLVLTTIACVPRAGAQGSPDDCGEQVDAYFQRLAAEQDFSGAVLVAKDGHIVLEEGYGSANDATGERAA